MKILVTGIAGFVGSHLTQRLLKDDHQIFGVDNMSNGRFSNIENCFNSGNFVFLEDDFTNALDQVEDVDVVIHLAAVGSVPRSLDKPDVTFANNVEKFHDLLCFMRNSNCRRLIYASSSSVLGGGSKEPNPLSPYAVSKYTNELYAEQFSKHFGINAIGLRFYNVYGKNQRSDSPYSAVIPRSTDNHIQLHEPGTQSRDFTYVKDVCEAIVLLLAKPDLPTQVYNVGYGESRSLYELLEILKRLLPERKFEYSLIPARAGDVLFSNCDNRQLKADTGWIPKYDLETGLNDMLFGD